MCHRNPCNLIRSKALVMNFILTIFAHLQATYIEDNVAKKLDAFNLCYIPAHYRKFKTHFNAV